jgi:hypothetical protein
VRIAVVGVGLTAVGGLPWALVRASWWQPPSEAVATVAGAVQTLTGYAGGVGYAAIAGRRNPRAGPGTTRTGAQRTGLWVHDIRLRR